MECINNPDKFTDYWFVLNNTLNNEIKCNEPKLVFDILANISLIINISLSLLLFLNGINLYYKKRHTLNKYKLMLFFFATMEQLLISSIIGFRYNLNTVNNSTIFFLIFGIWMVITFISIFLATLLLVSAIPPRFISYIEQRNNIKLFSLVSKDKLLNYIAILYFGSAFIVFLSFSIGISFIAEENNYEFIASSKSKIFWFRLGIAEMCLCVILMSIIGTRALSLLANLMKDSIISNPNIASNNNNKIDSPKRIRQNSFSSNEQFKKLLSIFQITIYIGIIFGFIASGNLLF